MIITNKLISGGDNYKLMLINQSEDVIKNNVIN